MRTADRRTPAAGVAPTVPGRPVVGVDLAWGRRARTGLCAVAADGTVTDSASVLTDDEIVEWVEARAPAPAVVGFDAPIVVANRSGRRRCETLVSRAFGAQRAGAHSSNLSMAAFADGGRAAALAAQMGLVLEPGAAAEAGLAAEVYPHAALVARFGLGSRIPYKAGRGRSVDARRSAFGELIGHVEALAGYDPPLLATSSPRWTDLVAAVGSAATHRQLNVAEDEIDAYVCAHVAACLAADLADGGRRVAVLGDWSSGAIVTPLDARHEAVLARLGEGG